MYAGFGVVAVCTRVFKHASWERRNMILVCSDQSGPGTIMYSAADAQAKSAAAKLELFQQEKHKLEWAQASACLPSWSAFGACFG